MIEHQVDQGGPEWHALRLGIPTASEFKRIVTPTGKLSASARDYAFRLVAETVLNRSLDTLDGIAPIERGKELEPEAVKLYEFKQRVKTRTVGFITDDNGRMGASPDRLVSDVGGLEIKCPAPQTHVEYLLDGWGSDYRPQVQGQLLIGELEWVDQVSYHPELPPVITRQTRDEDYIKTLHDALEAFCDMKDAMVETARAAGWCEAREKPGTPFDNSLLAYVERGISASYSG